MKMTKQVNNSIWEGAFLSVMLVMLSCILLTAPVAADAVSEAAAAQVSVTHVEIDPAIFFSGDTGTITVEITNSGNEKVAISRVTLYDNDITVLSNSYDAAGSIGAGNKMDFTFTVRADTISGIYYPVFSVDYRDAGYLRYPITLKVDDTPLKIAILDRPDTFSIGKKDVVNLSVGNPRDNQVNGVIVYPEGSGFGVTPSSFFIGALDPDSSREVSFSITPEQSSDVTIRVDYKNGINKHTATVTAPVTMGESKKQADPILSNINVESKNGIYSLTGDVTNAGLETANSVVITTSGGVMPVDPYRSYVVGSLKPDDFSSFENTFIAENVTHAEVVVTFKDQDGNTFTRSTTFEVPGGQPVHGTESSLPLPVIGLIIAVAAVILGIILYSWRRR